MDMIKEELTNSIKEEGGDDDSQELSGTALAEK